MSRFPKLSSFLVKSIAATPRTKMSTAKLHINEGKFTPAVLFILLTVLSILQRNSQLDHNGLFCKSPGKEKVSENSLKTIIQGQKCDNMSESFSKAGPEFFSSLLTRMRSQCSTFESQRSQMTTSLFVGLQNPPKRH